MLFMRNTAILISALVASISTVSAHPTERSLEARTVWAPHVTEPNAQTVWDVGTQQTIRWDTSYAPEDPTSTTATIYLGYLNEDGSGGENLDIDHPLATDVDLTVGEYTITVPYVQYRDSYVVALVGDSGNISDKFTIITGTQ